MGTLMKIRQTKDKYNIGTNIRKFRMENHMTQEQVVAKMQVLGIGISRSSYAQLMLKLVQKVSNKNLKLFNNMLRILIH